MTPDPSTETTSSPLGAQEELAEVIAEALHQACIEDWERREAHGAVAMTMHGVNVHFADGKRAARVAAEWFAVNETEGWRDAIRSELIIQTMNELHAANERIEELEAVLQEIGFVSIRTVTESEQ